MRVLKIVKIYKTPQVKNHNLFYKNKPILMFRTFRSMRGSRCYTTTAFGIYRARERREKTTQVTTCFESIFASEPTLDGAR